MGRVRAFTSGAQQAVRVVPEVAREARDFVVDPPFLEKKIDGATRTGQTVALLTVPIVIIVSLALIIAFNEVLADVFSGHDATDRQTPIFGFFITALTLGAFVFAAWTWFQYVRTAGFGVFSWD